jgi:beta-glucosidase
VHDTQRRDYIARHIAAVADAMQQGVHMEGYMVWSLLDNFEWASGYEKRFGIVHVDYETQVRTLKDSALWYRDFLRHQKTLRQTTRPGPIAKASSQHNAVAIASTGV